MSHAAQRAFFARVKAQFPAAFDHVQVLDCGSLDVNGSLRELFTESHYIGVDLQPGRGVDIVRAVHELPPAFDGRYDTVVSAEMLEHDEFWQSSLLRMYTLLRPGGLLVLSAAGPGRPEHGTRAVPDAAGANGAGVWGSSPDYYRPLSAEDLHVVLQPLYRFTSWDIEEDILVHDLYFWGWKP